MIIITLISYILIQFILIHFIIEFFKRKLLLLYFLKISAVIFNHMKRENSNNKVALKYETFQKIGFCLFLSETITDRSNSKTIF